MKCSAVVLGIALLAATVSAQTTFSGPQLPAALGATTTANLLTDTTQPSPTLWAEAEPTAAITAAAPVASAAALNGPPVLVTRPQYDWQLYAGYTFFRFYEIPTLKNTENGLDIGMSYFPRAGWIGGEGILMGTMGSQSGYGSTFVLAAGGVKLRWAGPRDTQFFLHSLAGGAHFVPQTAYGGQEAFGYEAGGGVDVAHGRRLALRGEVDAVGTRFFGTYQYSPKFSIGIVFKF